jgi:hypothetical protein
MEILYPERYNTCTAKQIADVDKNECLAQEDNLLSSSALSSTYLAHYLDCFFHQGALDHLPCAGHKQVCEDLRRVCAN